MRCVATLVLILDMPSSSVEIDKAPVQVVCREGILAATASLSLSDPPCFGLRLLLLYLILDTACSLEAGALSDRMQRCRDRQRCPGQGA